MGGLTPRRLGDISYHRVMSFLMSPNSLFRDLNNPFSLLIYLIHMLIHKNPTHTLNFISPYSAYLILLPRYPHFISYQNQGIPIHSSTCSPAHLGGLMAQLYEILMAAGVQETFADKLKDDGWTAELFAMCASSQDGFREELPEMLGTFHPITTPIQRSALLLAWHRCRQSMDQPPVQPPSQPATSTESTTPASSWSETFPPKLTGEVVSALK